MSVDADGIAREIAARLQLAWNEGVGEAFGAPFTADADFVDLRGTHHRGREAIAQGHQAIFDSVYRGSRVAYTVTDARLLAPDVILTHSTSRLNAPSGPMAGENDATQTLVLVREDDGWKIAAFHNTLVVPVPPR